MCIESGPWQGLRRWRLPQPGVSLVINGRDRELLEQTAQELRQSTGVEVSAVAADVSTREGQAALLAACSDTGHSDQQ